MSRILIIVTMLLFASTAMAAEISGESVRRFFDEWLAAQNNGSFSRYADMYSQKFVGIRRSGTRSQKLDYDAWLKDRKKMFKKKMIVASGNPQIATQGETATIKFEQTWESGTYKDIGEKSLELALDNGKLKIIREEMAASFIIPADKSDQNLALKNNKLDSKSSSIKYEDCKQVPRKISSYFDNRKLDRTECYAPGNWRLFTVVGGEYYWLELALGTSVWSTEDEVITKGDHRFGNFQSIDFGQVEWMISSTEIGRASCRERV